MIGVQQGDPLSGLLFDVVFHRLVLKIQDMLSLSKKDKVFKEVFIQLQYLDGGCIEVKHAALLKAITILSSPREERLSLHLALSKLRCGDPQLHARFLKRSNPIDL